MQLSDKVKVLQAFAISAAYYGRPITDDVASMYQLDVCDLPTNDVLHALRALRREPKRRTCPLPAEVRAFLENKKGGQTPEQVAARMAGALTIYGHTRAKQARVYIGEAGWQAVQDLGGWANLCRRVTTSELGTFTAQARELCRAHMDAPAMTHQDMGALPERAQNRLQVLASGVGAW